MDPSVVILILTGIFAVLGFGFIIIAILVSQNRLNNNMSDTRSNQINDDYKFNGEIPAPQYKRFSPKSFCVNSISTTIPEIPHVNHSISKSIITRELKEIISPNHWLGNNFYDTSLKNTIFNVYPYYGEINKDGFRFSWPENIILSKQHKTKREIITNELYRDNIIDADILLNIEGGIGMKIDSWDGTSISCDILDVDALVGTIAWQYRNNTTFSISCITIPLAKGSPFITAELNNIGVSLECNYKISMETGDNKSTYIINNVDNDNGYILFLSQSVPLKIINNTIYIPCITGTIRIAYFNSLEMIDILSINKNIYPIESTISVNDIEEKEIDINFHWTTRTIHNNNINPNTGLLMIALPHHNIVNQLYESSPINHSVIGPFKFVITENNQWIITHKIIDFPVEYPPIQSDISFMKQVWNTEIENLIKSSPNETTNWCKWIGSVAKLLLIGEMLKENISDHLEIFLEQLSRININNGKISTSNCIVYDITWGGLISNLAIDNYMGNSDSGNSYYQSHIGQFGYLVYAYAVAGHFDHSFIQTNKDIALFFARDIANPYQYDDYFPLWRNKDWYFGYSLSSGLSPDQLRGKDSSNIGESVFGYYATYLLSSLLDNHEFKKWSLAMLTSEILSAKFYFQCDDIININKAFIQKTITNRGDTYYEYTGNDTDCHSSIIKPISLVSFDYIKLDWIKSVQKFVNTKNQSDPESLAYSLMLLSINLHPNDKSRFIQNIIDNKNIYLPYGTTWSSILYWILKSNRPNNNVVVI